MPLPLIKSQTHKLKLHSTNTEVQFRPFLVKEEKMLVNALESEKDVGKTIQQVLKACIQTKGVDVTKLPTFDIEYLFLNLRAHSVGDKVEVNVLCPDDKETIVPLSINIKDIKVVETEGHSKQIKISDELMMEMKYPAIDQFIQNNFETENVNLLEQSFQLIASCVDKIYNEEEVWSAADVSKEEVIEFLEQMDTTSFKDVEEFFTTMPKLQYKTKVTNPNTGVESDVVIEGLNSFFGE